MLYHIIPDEYRLYTPSNDHRLGWLFCVFLCRRKTGYNQLQAVIMQRPSNDYAAQLPRTSLYMIGLQVLEIVECRAEHSLGRLAGGGF